MGLCSRIDTSGWIYPTLLLCLFGFFINMIPSDSFLIAYLTGPYHNLSAEQVTSSVLPVWTYGNFATLIPVFLITDYLRYKPVIMLQGLSGIIMFVLALFAHGVPAMQAMNCFNGIVSATEVAYFTYIYSMVDTEHYQRVTSYCRSVKLVGFTFSAVLGQILVSLAKISLFYINVFSLVNVSVAFVISLFLPIPSRSILFHRKEVEDTSQELSTDSNLPSEEQINYSKPRESKMKNLSRVCYLLCGNIKECYSSKKMIYWSLWWALATAGYNQVLNFYQVLFQQVNLAQHLPIYNGAVYGVSTFSGAVLSFLVSYVKVNWDLYGELALAIFSAVDAGALFLMYYRINIWMCYTGLLIFISSYMLLITITMFQIAINLSLEGYALVFGINNFFSMVTQTILTIIVVDPQGLGLDITTQFFVYGSYFAVIAGIYLVRNMYILISLHCKKSENDLQNALKKQTTIYGQ